MKKFLNKSFCDKCNGVLGVIIDNENKTAHPFCENCDETRKGTDLHKDEVRSLMIQGYKVPNIPKHNLMPPKNLRVISPRCCATCYFGMWHNGVYICERAGGEGVAEAEDAYITICDFYANQDTSS